MGEEGTNITNAGGFLQDNGGQPSCMRLMSFMVLIYGFLVAGYQIYTGKDVSLEIFFACLCAAFAPKVFQKLIENKFPTKNGNGG